MCPRSLGKNVGYFIKVAAFWMKCPVVSQNNRCKNIFASKRPVTSNKIGYFAAEHFETHSVHGYFYKKIGLF